MAVGAKIKAVCRLPWRETIGGGGCVPVTVMLGKSGAFDACRDCMVIA